MDKPEYCPNLDWSIQTERYIDVVMRDINDHKKDELKRLIELVYKDGVYDGIAFASWLSNIF